MHSRWAAWRITRAMGPKMERGIPRADICADRGAQLLLPDRGDKAARRSGGLGTGPDDRREHGWLLRGISAPRNDVGQDAAGADNDASRQRDRAPGSVAKSRWSYG